MAQFSGVISNDNAPDWDVDYLGLFGGGSLVGDPMTITYSYNTDDFTVGDPNGLTASQTYQDSSSPSRADGTIDVSINGYTLQNSVFGFAEILQSAFHYGDGPDSFALDVPGGFNVSNGTETQIFSGVSQASDFIPNYLNPIPPGFSLNDPSGLGHGPDPNEIFLQSGSLTDQLYYTATSVTVSGDASTTPEPSSLVMTIVGLIAGFGLCRRVLLPKNTII